MKTNKNSKMKGNAKAVSGKRPMVSGSAGWSWGHSSRRSWRGVRGRWWMSLLLLFATLSPLGAQSEGQVKRVLLCPQKRLVETSEGRYESSRFGPNLGGNWIEYVPTAMQELSERLRLISQDRMDEIGYLVDGDALDYQACLYATEQVWADTLQLLEHGFPSVVMELVETWSAERIASRYGLQEKDLRKLELGKVVGGLTDGKLREEKPVRRGWPNFRYFDGLRPYTYEGKHCLVLWDDGNKKSRIRVPNGERRGMTIEDVWNFSYSLKDVREIVLCRYSENCYALLLLTQPMVAMD